MFWLIVFQMHTAFSPALNSRTATWRLPRAAQSCLLITVWSCERQQTGVLSGRLIIGGWRMWKRRPASRGTRRARTFVCTHTSARAHWEASTGWHGQSCCWGVHGRRQRLCTTQLHMRFGTAHPSSGGRDDNMTQLTAPLWLASDTCVSSVLNLKALELLRSFILSPPLVSLICQN